VAALCGYANQNSIEATDGDSFTQSARHWCTEVDGLRIKRGNAASICH
jgi:hypothetical protein